MVAFFQSLEKAAIGMCLALIMAFNVGFIIWPNQQKVLGLIEASAAKAAVARPA